VQSIKNEGGGKTVVLVAGDSLDKVPKSHRDIITPQVREVFADPPGHFRRIADACPFPQMAVWLRALLAEDVWYLALHRGDPPHLTAAGFGWPSETVLDAEITPSRGKVPRGLPHSAQLKPQGSV
jgi:hypothetical protein